MRPIRTMSLGLGLVVGAANVAHAEEPASGTAAPPASAPAAGVTSGSAASLPTPNRADFNRELSAVEEQVEGMKQQVFESRATLQYLREIIVQGGAAGARATVWHDNRLSAGYRLESVTYQLDGQTKFAKVDPSNGLTDNRKFKIQEGALPPGRHTVAVDMVVRPTGYGIFKYAQGYSIGVKGSYAFDIELGQACTVVSALSDRGNVANSFEERAHIDFEWKCEKVTDANGR